MLACGIIAEYNPLHSGHKYHIDSVRAAGATHIAVVMSGNYVQRGEPAVFSKWARAQTALDAGADLVLELPTIWATASAERFGAAAVNILDSLGCIDILSFGCESGDARLLYAAAKTLLLPATSLKIAEYLKQGISYAGAREAAVRTVGGEEQAAALGHANNNLAIEYLKEIIRLKSKIEPLAISRKGAGHNDKEESDGFLSATAIRERIFAGLPYEVFLPPESRDRLRLETYGKKAPVSYKNMETAILYKLRSMSAEDFLNIADVSEGLENRLRQAAQQALSLDEFFSLVKTKRYALSRIRRIALSAFLGITKAETLSSPRYIRVLALNRKGGELLKKAKETASLPVIMRAADISKLGGRARSVFETECRVTDIYALAMPQRAKCGMEMTTEVIVKDL